MLTNEDLQAALTAKAEHGRDHLAAAALGLPVNTFVCRLKAATKRGLVPFSATDVPEGFEITQVTETPKGNFTQMKPEPGPAFEMPTTHVVKGYSALSDGEGRTKLLWTKTKLDTVVPDLVAALKTTFEQYEGHAPLIHAFAPVEQDLLSVYPIADQHNGLLAWGRETGESYDLKIGAARLRETLTRLVDQSPASKEAVILNLGDWQHTDDQKNQTPGHGNILDVDSRYFKLLQASIQLGMDCIELALQKHENVEYRGIPGNHDPHASIAMTMALSAFYRSNPRVIINMDPSDFYYRRFGQTLIGACHGHKMKPDRMAMNMAVTRRKDWGETAYHWFLFGHIHHETMREVGDVRCESFQTLAAKDAYSSSHGYTAGQSLNSITLHLEDGEIGRHRVNILPPDMRKKP
jgi:predicted phosphodiesterase